ncbi:nitroreductase/quinone reductase family protein [Actinoplanes sp. NPDC051851]|uniref:nitroreductase/quinone reductase family protein n=1 Tax=Actinoplanes sp. NPDC051851 TaxID=3154753 RepID=UPI0034263C79
MTLEGYAAATEFNQPIIDDFRANDGKVSGMFEGAALALLTTVGARTGLPRTSPVGWVEVDGDQVAVASAGGGPVNPSWYHNIVANPWLTVEVDTDKYQALAEIPHGSAREELWQKVIAVAPGYADYQKQTSREIPLVIIKPQEGPNGARLRGIGAELQEVHDWLRKEMAELRDQVDDYLAGRTSAIRTPQSPEDPATALRTHCMTFCQALNVHHTGEDDHAFPVLQQRFPALTPILDDLRAEHVVVARINKQIEALVTDVDSWDGETLRAELDRLTTELETHLKYEEETLSAALNAMGPAPQRRP